MLLWKLLLVADLALLAGYSVAVWRRRERLQRSDYVTVPIGLLGTAGLGLYALSLPAVSPLFWRIILPLLALSGTWEISRAVTKQRLDVGTAIGAGLALALLGFTCVAVYRLGGAHWLESM